MKKLIGCIAVTIFIVVMISAQSTTSPVGGQGYGSWGSPIYAIWSDSAGWSIFADSAGMAVIANKADSLAKRGGYVPGDSFLVCYGDTFSWLYGDSLYINGNVVVKETLRIDFMTADDSTTIWFVDDTVMFFHTPVIVYTPHTGGIGFEARKDALSTAAAFTYAHGVSNDDTLVVFLRSGIVGDDSTFAYIDTSGQYKFRNNNGMFWTHTLTDTAYTNFINDKSMNSVSVVCSLLVEKDIVMATSGDIWDAGTIEADTFFGVHGAVGNCQVIYAESLYSCSPIEVAGSMRIDGGDLIVADGQKLIITDDTEADTFALYHNGDAGYLAVDDYMVFRFGGVSKMNFNSSNMLPLTDGGINLGGDANSFGNLYIDGESFLGNNVVDTITFTGLSWFVENAWFPSGDTLWFRDASGADSAFIVNDGSYFMFGGDVSPYFAGQVTFHGNLYQDADNKTNTFNSNNWRIDNNGNDSLSFFSFGVTDSLAWDSIPEDFYITCGLWLPETLFFTDGRGGADTSGIIQNGTNLAFFSDNDFLFNGNVTADTFFGVIGSAGNCQDIWADTIYGCSPIFVAANLEMGADSIGIGIGTADSAWIYDDGSATYFRSDNFLSLKGWCNISVNQLYGATDTVQYLGTSARRWKEVWALRHYGSSPDDADSFVIYDDGDTTHFDSDNPIKIGGASLVVGTDGKVTIDSLVAATSIWWHIVPISIMNAATGASGATFTVPNTNTIGGYQLNAATEYLYLNGNVSAAWDAATDIEVKVAWEINAASVAADDTVELDLLVYYKKHPADTCKYQALNSRTGVGNEDQYTMHVSTFTIDHDLAANVVAKGDKFTLRLNLDTGSSEIDDVIINDARFRYKSKLSQPITY